MTRGYSFLLYREETSLRPISKPSKIEDTPLAKQVEQEGAKENGFNPDMTFKPTTQILPENNNESLEVKPTEENKLQSIIEENSKDVEETKLSIVKIKAENLIDTEKDSKLVMKAEHGVAKSEPLVSKTPKPEVENSEVINPKDTNPGIEKPDILLIQLDVDNNNVKDKVPLQQPSKQDENVNLTVAKKPSSKQGSDKQVANKLAKVGAKLQIEDKLRPKDRVVISRNSNQGFKKTNSLDQRTSR